MKSFKRVFVFTICCFCFGLAAETVDKLREKRWNIYRDLMRAGNDLSKASPFKKDDELIIKIGGLFKGYANGLVACLQAGDKEFPQEFRWSGYWDDRTLAIHVQTTALYEKLVETTKNKVQPSGLIAAALSQLENDFAKRGSALNEMVDKK